tara:strand:- start:165 stop:1994 length:1830 start_codon:yes stop_codon:yes gene_type:complete
MRRIAKEMTKQLKAQSGNGSGIDKGSNNPNHFAGGRKGVNGGGGGGLSGMSAEQQQLLQGGSIHPSLLSSQQLQHISASIGVKGNKIPAQPRKPIETTSDGAPIDISSMLQDLSEKDTQTFHKCYAILHDHVGGSNNPNQMTNLPRGVSVQKHVQHNVNTGKNGAITTTTTTTTTVNNISSNKFIQSGMAGIPSSTNSNHNMVGTHQLQQHQREEDLQQQQQQPITPHNSANMHVPLETPRRYKHTQLLLQLLSKSNFMKQAVPISSASGSTNKDNNSNSEKKKKNTRRKRSSSNSNNNNNKSSSKVSNTSQNIMQEEEDVVKEQAEEDVLVQQQQDIDDNGYDFEDANAITSTRNNNNNNNNNDDDEDDNVFGSIVSPTMGNHGPLDVDIAKFAENLLATPRSSEIMNSSGGIISGNNTPMNMYTYGNLNGVGPNDLPDVNFQEVADYFNLSSPLLSMSSLVGGQSTGSAKGKAKFTFDDFDVQSSTKNRTNNKRRGVNPSVAAIINNPPSSLSRNNNKKHNRRGGVDKDDDNLLQPPKKRKKKGVISVNTELANNPNCNNSNTKHQGSNDNNKNDNSSYGNNNNKGSKMKELPPSARFAKEMWGRKR